MLTLSMVYFLDPDELDPVSRGTRRYWLTLGESSGVTGGLKGGGALC